MKITFRNIMAYGVASLYKYLGIINQHKNRLLQNESILSIYFHKPSKLLFENCIHWLMKNGFQFITVEDIVAISKGEKPFPKGAVVITVDDGWKCNKNNIVAVADSLKIPITIFISTDPVEHGDAYWWSYVNTANKRGVFNENAQALKKMNNTIRKSIVNEIKLKILLAREALTVDDINEINLSKFISIGSHTVSHPILTTCSDEEVYYELSASKLRIEDMICEQVNSFAYPNGAYTDREIRQLKKIGYSVAFCTQPGVIDRTNIHNIYNLPRFEILEDASFTENVCRMSGAWFLKEKLLFKS